MTAAAPVAAAPVAAGAVANPHLAAWRAALEDGRGRVRHAAPTIASGRLTRAVGLVLEAVGLQLPLGADCLVELPPGQGRRHAEAEVVGFSGERLLLMPQTDVSGLLPGARVFAAGDAADASGPGSATKQLPVGAGLLGRVLDAAGRPLDGLGPVPCERKVPLAAAPINPLARAPIRSVLDVGVRAINALLTVGRGQRMGLFAGSGVGKSVLLGMMARYTSADVIVVGLIGERGREVKEFIEHTLGADGLARAVVVAAPADTSPLLRLQGAAYATCLAEFFRDQGRDVLLIMDRSTRYADAQREIALAVGEPPATKGYPPRFRPVAGAGGACRQRRHGGGSITALLHGAVRRRRPAGPDRDAARAILDGHVVLSRSLAEAGHYRIESTRGVDRARCPTWWSPGTSNWCGGSSRPCRATSATETWSAWARTPLATTRGWTRRSRCIRAWKPSCSSRCTNAATAPSPSRAWPACSSPPEGEPHVLPPADRHAHPARPQPHRRGRAQARGSHPHQCRREPAAGAAAAVPARVRRAVARACSRRRAGEQWRNYQFLQALDSGIAQQRAVLAQAQARLERGRSQWQQQRRRLNAFETLAERLQRQDDQAQARREQRAGDEHAARLHQARRGADPWEQA